MSETETFHVCPYCKKPVSPSDVGVHFARELRDLGWFGQESDFVEGRGAYLHHACPVPHGWASAPIPEK